jgi:hypothetical protein
MVYPCGRSDEVRASGSGSTTVADPVTGMTVVCDADWVHPEHTNAAQSNRNTKRLRNFCMLITISDRNKKQDDLCSHCAAVF